MRRTLALCTVGVLVAGGLTVAGVAAAEVTGGSNLVVNGDAETGGCTTSGYDATTVPGWSVTTGSADTVCYGTANFPAAGVPGPADRGRAFFSGGATGDATMTQTVDVGAAAAAVDGGGVTFALSGWFGGWQLQNDRAGLVATFVDRAGATLGTAQLAPVTSGDRRGSTGFRQRTAQGAVPAGTREVLLALQFTWTTGSTTDGYADDLALTLSAAVPTRPVPVPPSSVPRFDHVFFAYLENENYAPGEAPAGLGDYVVGNPKAPYLNGTIAGQGALLSAMYATTHPSDPNYLAVSGGSTFGWSGNPTVGTDRIDAVHLGDRLDAAGRTWKGYAEGMSGNCDTSYHNTPWGGYYLPDDEPFMLYADVVGDSARCAAHNQPLSQLATDLRSAATTPDFVWFAANDRNDMEQGGVAVGDTWLRGMLPEILTSPAWTTQRSLLILSWDEGYAKAYGPSYPNHVPTYVLASHGLVKAGYTSPTRYTQYGLGRTVEEALGLAPLTSNDRYAVPLGDVWTTGG